MRYHPLMKLFIGCITVPVDNLEAAARWYAEKLNLQNEGYKQDETSGFYQVVSRDALTRIVLVSREEGGEDRPILNTDNAAKAREWLQSRGVNAGPVETDRQGTHFFEMRDLEENLIEICEEP
jgi:catechol 2,3-dioxygenase-like lactoylglutathione lyase family enzyme